MPRQQTLEAFGIASSSSRASYQSQKAKSPTKAIALSSPTTTPKGRRLNRPKPSQRDSPEQKTDSDSDEDVRAIKFESAKEDVIELSDDSDSQAVAPSSTQRASRRRRAPTTPPSSGSESPLTEVSGGDEDDDDVALVGTTRRSKKRVLVDSDEDIPKRRKLVRGKARSSSSEEDDIDSTQILDSRLRGPSKKTAFSSKLEALKKRRNGAQSEPEPEMIEDSDSGSDSDIVISDKNAPFSRARPDGENLPDVEDDDAEDDDFVVEDDGDDVPVELPAQFSRQSHQDLSMHFKVVCQLFVLLAVQPEESREQFMRKARSDEYFALSLNSLDRKLGSLRDSLVRSSVWKPNFTKTLSTYPEFALSDLDYSVPGCDACNRGTRTSTLLGRCSGSPYSSNTFEPKESQDSDEDDDDDDDDPLAFNLGRFCAARGKVYHAFTHWQYLLYSSLESEVALLQSPRKRGKGQAFTRISRGRGVEPPQDVQDGNQVMTWLDERGIIQAEWQKIKQLMERAHKLDSQRNVDDDDLA